MSSTSWSDMCGHMEARRNLQMGPDVIEAATWLFRDKN